jgi:L-threonylcarbamoyladenylate synthase
MELIFVTNKNRQNSCALAGNYLLSGRLVIAKADTSYAILSLPHNKTAQKNLAKIKHDRRDKLFSVFVPSRKYITDRIINPVYRSRIKKLLPGALTVVTGDKMPGMRYISRLTISRIMAIVKQPLTATSANPSNEAPARSFSTIYKYFDRYNVLVLYEKTVPKTLPSTIVDVSRDNMKILRQGSVVIE